MDNAAFFGEIIGAFAVSLLLAAVWLIISKFINPLKSNPKISYGIAAIFSIIPPILSYSGIGLSNVLGSLLCLLIIFWQFKRTQNNLNKT